MTLKQLSKTHASFLREFNKAVIQRRANIKKFMAGQMAMRRKSKNPNRSNTPSAIKATSSLSPPFHSTSWLLQVNTHLYPDTQF